MLCIICQNMANKVFNNSNNNNNDDDDDNNSNSNSNNNNSLYILRRVLGLSTK